MRLLVWVVGVVLCIGFMRTNLNSATKRSQVSLAIGGATQDEYEIWTVAIKNVIEDSRPPEMILINEETGNPPSGSEYDLATLLDYRPELPPNRRTDEWNAVRAGLLADTLADFEQKNVSTDFLLNKFHLPLRTVTITERELSRLRSTARNHFWETLRKKYPHAIGVFRVSRIGFNSSRTQAIVYVQYQSGPEGGDGRYVLLRKENGAWRYRAAAIAWMS